MSTFGISEKSYKLLLNTFASYPQIEEVIIFGSRVKKNSQKGSDIDLAIKGRNCDQETAVTVAAYINEELPIPYHVDVVHYDSLQNQELKAHIDRVGKVFFRQTNKLSL